MLDTLSLPFLSFVSTALLVLALAPPGGRTLRARLGPYAQRPLPVRERVLAGSFVQRVLAPAAQGLLRLASTLTPGHIRQQAALDLARAGQPMAVETYLALRGVAMLGLPLAYLAYQARAERDLDLLGFAAVAALFLAGRRGSQWWVKSRIQRRQARIERALPSALDLITVCMEAGLSFDAGVAKVVEKTRGPLSDELARALQEMQIGRPRREALRDVARRAEVRDLSSFVAAIVQADQMGMSLGPVMRAQADDVRTRRRQAAEELAMKAPVKMLFPLMFCILPATLLVVLGPAMVTLYTRIIAQLSLLR